MISLLFKLKALPQKNMFRFSELPSNFKIDYVQGVDIITRDYPGSLKTLLSVFKDSRINLTSIEPRLLNKEKEGLSFKTLQQEDLKNLLFDLEQRFDHVLPLREENSPNVPWFPRTAQDLSFLGRELLNVKDEMGKDSPQFMDKEYKERRDYIGSISKSHKIGQPVPLIDYTENENQAWRTIYSQLEKEHQGIMCERYSKNLKSLEKELGFKDKIPQLRDIDQFLKEKTGFRLKATHGILSQREFLNALGHRIFCCTQYIRNHKNLDYTPEPDIVHELLGHVVMFADKEVADISQEIGLLSCGASDEQVAKLGAIYWYTVEFGAVKDAGGKVKAWGAGIGGSIAECQFLKNFYKVKHIKLNPFVHAEQAYPIQTVQPSYMYSDSLEQQLQEIIQFGQSLSKPFNAFYDFGRQEIISDRKIVGCFKQQVSDLAF